MTVLGLALMAAEGSVLALLLATCPMGAIKMSLGIKWEQYPKSLQTGTCHLGTGVFRTEAQRDAFVWIPPSCLHPQLILEACLVLPMAEGFPVILPVSLSQSRVPRCVFFFL